MTISNTEVVDTTVVSEAVAADPVEEAAQKFTKLLPFVAKLGNAANSKGSLVRVLHAMAEFPLGASKPRLLNDSERQLFTLLQELTQAKSVMLSSFMKESLEAEKLKKQAAEAAEKEVSNGGNEEK